MKILYTSDTHYGHSSKTKNIHEAFLKKGAEKNPDIIIHAGDIESHKLEHFKCSLKMFREYFPDIPILVTLGNHDWWNATKGTGPTMYDTYYRVEFTPTKTMSQIKKFHQEVFGKYDIHYLEESPYLEKEGIKIYGYDGWYHYPEPLTNDGLRIMGRGFDHKKFQDRTHKNVNKILMKLENNFLENQDKTIILVSHFDLTPDPGWEGLAGNPRYLDFFRDHVDYFIVGHSHQKRNNMLGSMNLLNCGSDYDDPKWGELNIQEKE